MSGERTGPPFRADHVGSLLRPKSLTRAFRKVRSGEMTDEEFRATQDEAIREAVALQEAVGLQSITDGEFRRASYWARFVERVDGLEVRDAVFQFRDEAGHAKDFTAPHVSAKVRRTRGIACDEYEFLKGTTTQTPKITLPSPPTMHFWRVGVGVAREAYADPEEFFDDLAAVYREEIAELAQLGATYIQLDDVPLAMLCDPAVRDQVRRAGADPDKLVTRYVDLLNRAIGQRPEGMSATVHLCRGNFKAHFLSEGGYDAVAERLFNEVDADGFFLEYDTPRAGDFGPLRFVPRGKVVVLGLVSTKTPQLESERELRRRIDDAGRYLPLEQLALSPQCGFASTAGGNPLTVDDESRKLALVVKVAGDVWGR